MNWRRREFLLAGLAESIAVGSPAQTPRGFSGAAWTRQKRLEARLLATPRAARIGAHMDRMAAEPHHAGSPAGKLVAEYALSRFAEYGFSARIETFSAYLPYPLERTVELLSPSYRRLRLQEPNFAEDPDSNDRGQLPTYNAYSGEGDVTGELVYVNYGVPEDYAELARRGVDVRGKVVLARYGQSWRGVKPKVAAEHGAAACLIYSDPKEDGYSRGAVYPEGPYRCEDGVQRGSVMDMSIHVGDPLTPGWASEEGARRLRRDEARTLMPIPVLPISYGDARPLLDALEGDIAPESWRGGLPVTYRIGPGPGTVRVRAKFDHANRPVRNVIGVVRGSIWPNQWVIYGNHHDAWVNGAHDPVSGAAAVLECARTLGAAVARGWKPRRTLVVALWDAEEFGLVGSTEWVEKHLDELREKAVVYLNSDMNGRGRIGGGASPSLSLFLEEVARDANVRRPAKWRLSPLGSGSDYVGFVHHAGIASANLGFGGDDSGGVYHSIFDSIAWYRRFSDGNHEHGRALAAYMALAMARMSEAVVPPFSFVRLGESMREEWNSIKKLAAGKVDLPSAVDAAIDRTAELAQSFERAYGKGAGGEAAARAVYLTERALQLENGLPGRPWYRHALTAPGQYTGYGAKTMPGVREAIELGRPEEAREQAGQLALTLEHFNQALEKAIAALG